MNELNFARFDAKLEQRLAELRAELKQDFSALDRKVDVGLADLKTYIERVLRDQTRWFILAWAALVAAWATLVALNIGLWFRMP